MAAWRLYVMDSSEGAVPCRCQSLGGRSRSGHCIHKAHSGPGTDLPPYGCIRQHSPRTDSEISCQSSVVGSGRGEQ